MAEMNRFLAKQVKENTDEIANIKVGSVARYVEGTETATGYSVTVEDASPFVNGLLLLMKVPRDSIAGAALNYSGVGDRPIKVNNEPLKYATLRNNSVCFIRYNALGDYWEVISGGNFTDVVVNGNGINYADTTGTGMVYGVDIVDGPEPYIGFALMLRAHIDSSDAQMLNYNGGGNLMITNAGEPINTGTLKAKSVFIVTYVGSSWELISGSGDGAFYYFGDDVTLGGPKYHIIEDVVDGQTSFGILGGDIDSYDPAVEMLRYIVNGIEQVPGLDYLLDELTLTVELIGKDMSASDVHVLIRYRNVSLIPKGSILSPTISSGAWVKVGSHYESTISVKNINESTNVLFSVHEEADSSQVYEFSHCKVKAITVSENKIVIRATIKPRINIRCSVMVVRNNSSVPKESALYPIILDTDWYFSGEGYETFVTADYILYGANILFAVHEDSTESQVAEYASCRVKASDIVDDRIIIKAIRKPTQAIQCSILITR